MHAKTGFESVAIITLGVFYIIYVCASSYGGFVH
jgi:hypothetical protein